MGPFFLLAVTLCRLVFSWVILSSFSFLQPPGQAGGVGLLEGLFPQYGVFFVDLMARGKPFERLADLFLRSEQLWKRHLPFEFEFLVPALFLLGLLCMRRGLT